MARLALSAFLVFSTIGSCECFAQRTASATAAVTVNVVRGLAITESKGLSFGQLPQGSGTHTILSTSPGVGSFTVSGEPGASVSITFPNTVTLQDPDGDLLAFSPEIPIWNSENSQSSNQQVFPAVTGGHASLSSNGTLYVWFGGSINTDNAATGSYSGQYTITVTY